MLMRRRSPIGRLPDPNRITADIDPHAAARDVWFHDCGHVLRAIRHVFLAFFGSHWGARFAVFIGDSNSTGRNVDSDDRFSRSFIFHDVIPFLFQIFGAAMALQLDWSLLLVAMLGQNLRSGLELIHCLFLHFNVFRS